MKLHSAAEDEGQKKHANHQSGISGGKLTPLSPLRERGRGRGGEINTIIGINNQQHKD
ncbi:MAG: hypothetical protein ABW170_15260 [Candidatus Thiodiazotropha sp. L084R]